jgi:DNA-binding winged helix-turn-helix (wHTH) protein
VVHSELLSKVWGPEYRDDVQYLRVWISRVRRKLGSAPGDMGRIKTFQGIGYLLDVEPPTEPLEISPEDVAAVEAGASADEVVAAGEAAAGETVEDASQAPDGSSSSR